jgi:hypothetical protein
MNQGSRYIPRSEKIAEQFYAHSEKISLYDIITSTCRLLESSINWGGRRSGAARRRVGDSGGTDNSPPEGYPKTEQLIRACTRISCSRLHLFEGSHATTTQVVKPQGESKSRSASWDRFKLSTTSWTRNPKYRTKNRVIKGQMMTIV